MTRQVLTDAENALGRVLAPLVAATRPSDFIGPESTVVQVKAYFRVLGDVPLDVVKDVVDAFLNSGEQWMPKPGQIKTACAKVIDAKRSAAAAEHLAECARKGEHPGFFKEVEIDGVTRLQRCEHWEASRRAMDAVAAPLALPPADVEPRDSQVW